MRHVAMVAVCCWGLVAALSLGDAPGDEPKKEKNGEVPVVKELDAKGLRVDRVADKPAVIKNAEDLAKAFPERADQARLLKQVDWKEQVMLVFAWSGSGQSKLTHEIKKGKDAPEVIFTHIPGVTLDLVEHRKVYVLRKGVSWKLENAKLPRG